MTFLSGFNADNTIILSVAKDLASNSDIDDGERYWWTYVRKGVDGEYYPVATVSMSQHGITLEKCDYGYNYRIAIMKKSEV